MGGVPVEAGPAMSRRMWCGASARRIAYCMSRSATPLISPAVQNVRHIMGGLAGLTTPATRQSSRLAAPRLRPSPLADSRIGPRVRPSAALLPRRALGWAAGAQPSLAPLRVRRAARSHWRSAGPRLGARTLLTRSPSSATSAWAVPGRHCTRRRTRAAAERGAAPPTARGPGDCRGRLRGTSSSMTASGRATATSRQRRRRRFPPSRWRR